MDSHSTPPAATSATPAPTLIKHGAGVGAAIGTAISTCIGIGLSATWVGGHPSEIPTAILCAIGGVLTTALFGAACGAVIGWSVPASKPVDTH